MTAPLVTHPDFPLAASGHLWRWRRSRRAMSAWLMGLADMDAVYASLYRDAANALATEHLTPDLAHRLCVAIGNISGDQDSLMSAIISSAAARGVRVSMDSVTLIPDWGCIPYLGREPLFVGTINGIRVTAELARTTNSDVAAIAWPDHGGTVTVLGSSSSSSPYPAGFAEAAWDWLVARRHALLAQRGSRMLPQRGTLVVLAD